MAEGDEFRRFFDSYADCYDRLDSACAAAHHGTPSFVVNRGEIVRVDAESILDYFDSVFSENATAGDHDWEVADLDVRRLASNGAVATVGWIARRPDGSTLWTSRATYMLADDGEGWSIWGDIVHSPD